VLPPVAVAGVADRAELRAVGGLTSAEIAHAFFVPEATMAQRISRAKAGIRKAGAVFAMPPAAERQARLEAVLGVLYLIFNEGYVASSGPELQRRDLTAEAIRLTRMLHALLAGEAEVAGLLALMLLTDARREARVGADGSLVALADQERTRWNSALIAEGSALIAATLGGTAELGPYQLQAAIAAVHAEAGNVAETDWPQILALYDLLERVAPNPMVTLNRSVAVAMVHGPAAGLELVSALEGDERMARHHRLHAVRAHLLELDGRAAEARDSYRLAARYALSLPEKRYLERRAAAGG
jgi:predicted RNA polymerase sigma factor